MDSLHVRQESTDDLLVDASEVNHYLVRLSLSREFHVLSQIAAVSVFQANEV